MKSLPFISFKQSNELSLFVRSGGSLFLRVYFIFGIMFFVSCFPVSAADQTISTTVSTQVIPDANSTLTITSAGGIITSGSSDSVATTSSNSGASINNQGVIDGVRGFFNHSGTMNSIINSGQITGSSIDAIENQGNILSITNSVTGTITGTQRAIHNDGGSISSITNMGSITTTANGREFIIHQPHQLEQSQILAPSLVRSMTVSLINPEVS